MQLKDKTSGVQTEVHYINYEETGFFSRIVLDYLKDDEQLSSFYQYTPDINGIKQAIEDRKDVHYDRNTLVSVLKDQYKDVTVSAEVEKNINLLLEKNTFTITTAHQPNIFTGPLYFVYKILHAIKLAETLKENISSHHFVPVFFMGSEDADLDELGNFTVDGKRYEWKTKQTGAVGRMKVDKAFTALINELENQISVLPFGKEMITLFRNVYKEGQTIQQCTLELVNALFGEFGLVVIIPDNAALKKVFVPVVEKELRENFSHKVVAETLSELGKHYKVQTGGRELNLFYLLDDKRERIQLSGSSFTVQNLNLRFTEEEILNELQQYPERFSPNVILRGAFQEMILPNIAFIGGGGELAYWLELKNVFKVVGIPYPVLLLRNSFLLMHQSQVEQLTELGFEINDLFKSNDELLNALTIKQSQNKLSLSEEKGELNSFYQELHESVLHIDSTLAEHVNALQAKALKKVNELEKKMLRVEKRKFETEEKRIQKLRSVLFPKNSLQERVENISGFYAREGKEIINEIYKHSLALEQKFTVIIV